MCEADELALNETEAAVVRIAFRDYPKVCVNLLHGVE